MSLMSHFPACVKTFHFRKLLISMRKAGEETRYQIHTIKSVCKSNLEHIEMFFEYSVCYELSDGVEIYNFSFDQLKLCSSLGKNE